MVALTQKERETILILLKNYTEYYNANSISKILRISHVGAQKILKRLFQENIVTSKQIGKAITYKINFNNDYALQLASFLLADEANNFKRWKEEFKDLFKQGRIIMLFGSTIKNYESAKDIDIMIVLRNEEATEVNKFLNKKKELLPKRLHAIKLSHQDFEENLKRREKPFVDIIKNAIVIYGQDKYVEHIKNVTSL